MSRKLPPPEPGPLLPWLLVSLRPMSRSKVKQLLASGRVRVNGVAVTQFDHALAATDRVTIGEVEPDLGLPVVFRDADLLVVDKPAGLLTVATDREKLDTAFARLNATLPTRPFVVHRLDRETSGLLLFALGADIRDRLQAAWPTVTKVYAAVVEGVPDPPAGTIRTHLLEGADLRVREVPASREGAKEAITHYETISTGKGRSLLRVRIETGRRHQIRVHLSGIGNPVVGDRVHGATTDPLRRLGLHAWELRLAHPRSGEAMHWTCEPPFRG